MLKVFLSKICLYEETVWHLVNRLEILISIATPRTMGIIQTIWFIWLTHNINIAAYIWAFHNFKLYYRHGGLLFISVIKIWTRNAEIIGISWNNWISLSSQRAINLSNRTVVFGGCTPYLVRFCKILVAFVWSSCALTARVCIVIIDKIISLWISLKS